VGCPSSAELTWAIAGVARASKQVAAAERTAVRAYLMS
jgi:hypothetical protein